MPFKPGDPNINRSGRPRGAAGVAKYAAEVTDDGREVIDFLVSIMRNKGAPRERVQAALAILDRLAGKPLQPQQILLALEPPPPVDAIMLLPPDQRMAWLDAERQRRSLPPVATLVPETDGDPDDE